MVAGRVLLWLPCMIWVKKDKINMMAFDVKLLLITALTVIIMLLIRYEALFPLVLSGLMLVWIQMEQEALQHYGLSLKPKVTAPDSYISLNYQKHLLFPLGAINVLGDFHRARLCIFFFGAWEPSNSCLMKWECDLVEDVSHLSYF